MGKKHTNEMKTDSSFLDIRINEKVGLLFKNITEES